MTDEVTEQNRLFDNGKISTSRESHLGQNEQGGK